MSAIPVNKIPYQIVVTERLFFMFVMQLIENAFKILISSLSVLYKCDITVFNKINKINIFYNFFSLLIIKQIGVI